MLTALAIAPSDPGRPELAEGRTIDCGRPQGYRDRQLHQLHQLALHAHAAGERIWWD